MNRAGYEEQGNSWEYIRWRGAVRSACRGRRGQEFFKELLRFLDEMPDPYLARDTLQSEGRYCIIGLALNRRGLDMPDDDSVWGDPQRLAEMLGISHAQCAEIINENDECHLLVAESRGLARWAWMREWVSNQIIQEET